MHPNPAYRGADAARNIGFARDRGFGVLCVNGEAGPLVAHVPFILDAEGRTAGLHLVRSNPIVRALAAPRPALLAVSGPDSYVSPDWYGIDDQVPTWNYVAVHLRGVLTLCAPDALRDTLDRQSAVFEERLQPKVPWRADKMPPALLDRMMRQIVALRLQVATVEGTWKLNQTKPDAVRERAAGHVAGSHVGSDAALLAALMLAPPQG